ncbi:UDP-2,4-diacetamido-2,4,6-trideoxy-beta-L-altropyranose hydrolase [Geobacter sp.]|uniref:UDP-2,4-diacetamido-2,4, 6-trideoxy-beta-L-altropyranose hydrolase n=1 Tax=Geobacter sp. TaxID=46610 RepID=UPI0027BA43A4|nr:UDP-2,4-diacetamido-2,4,6-trideoxy-beta-L-altropyranose hydrolase [Geobacter sp.]
MADRLQTVIIRADASIPTGSGHVMRCLTLAESLAERGANVSFLCRELPGNLCDHIEARGFRTLRLAPEGNDAAESEAVLRKERPNLLIVDHYDLDTAWESPMRPHVGRIMVIDDLANRRHDCDLLLDQNYYADLDSRYRGLVPETCRLFLGPRHALLRREFFAARSSMKERDGTVTRVLVFFGGSDSTNETGKVLDALARFRGKNLSVDVVVGASNPRREELRKQCAAIPGVAFHCQVQNMARFMAEADFAFGAGGTATWERCFLGLPTAAIVLAQNQLEVIRAVERGGALRNLGWHDDVTVDRIVAELEWAMSNPGAVREMGIRALALMGSGAAREESPLVRALLGEGDGSC